MGNLKRIKRWWRLELTALVVLVLAALFAHYGPLQYSILQSVRDGDCEQVDRLLRWDPFLVNTIYTTDPGWTRGRASLLTEASCCRHTDIVELLVTRGADVNWHGWGLATALHDLAEYDDGKTMRLLILKGADVNAEDAMRRTPLHDAAEAGNRRAVELLLANGADINARDKYGKAALDHAVETGHSSIADLLRDHGGERIR